MSLIDNEAALSLMADYYEITMSGGYFDNGMSDTVAYFDMFFRRVPDGGGFAIMAGLEQFIEFIEDLKFTEEDIAFLRSKGIYSEGFLSYLKSFKFECDVFAVEEGTPIFPREPVVIVRGPVIQAQLIETALLMIINHQSLIATKANRIVRAAQGRSVMEFGARRAHGLSAALYGARAAYIGGCVGSSLTLAEKLYGIPAVGTMAHSWVQMFDSELDAFRVYAKTYPENCSLLVDTYNVLKSGVPNAIKVFNEEILPRGYRPQSIRIDSGDITYLSKRARKMLDEAGFPDCAIIATNSLDENIIREVIIQGGKVDSFGVGERLITASSDSVFGGVYKLAGIEKDGRIIPKIKISENRTKLTTPGFKQVHRLFDKTSGKAIADVVTLHGESIDENAPYEIFDPEYTWKRKTVTDFIARPLHKQIYKNGKLVYKCPPVQAIKDYCESQVSTLWDEVLRLENPHNYYVDLSPDLWQLRKDLLNSNS